ncbi:MAG: hypothetical protein V4563_16540 [Pseudomonadota bacterium]
MTLDQVLAYISAGVDIAGQIPGAGAASAIAAIFLRIAQSAVKAHEQVTGEPLDLAKLHELPHV